jgi:hypothetical protein
MEVQQGMKTTLSTLGAIVGFLAFGATAFAQSASVTSGATIETPISATATSALAFGTITKGATATVAGTAATAAGVTFSGDESDNITLSIPTTATISTTSGEGASMTVTISRGSLRVNTANSQSTAAALDASSGSATTALSSDASGNGTASDGLGQTFLWIGGTVSPAATQQRGIYTGSFTVSAAYSN